MGDYEAGKSQNFNEFVYNGISSGRDSLAALHQKLKNREISPDDFNRATMSMGSQMDDFKTLTTNYNKALITTQQGVEEGRLSGLSTFAADRLGSIADFKNKNLQWMPSQNGYTRLYINPIDENGKITGEPISVTSLVTPGNLEYKRTDVDAEATKFTSQLGKYKVGRVLDATEKEGYERVRTDIVNSIVNSPSDVASILSEYAGYEFYEEGQPKPEGKSLKVKIDDNHMLVPDVDPDNHNDPAVKEARRIAEERINQQVDYIKTDKPITTENDDEKKRLKNLTTGYQITLNASRGDFTGMNKSLYTFKETKNGIEVRRKTDTKTIGIHVGKDALKPGTRATAKILSQYTREFSASGSQTEWDEIDTYLGEGKGKDVSIDIVEQEVEGKPFAPSMEDITIQTLLWNGGDDAGHLGVNNADSEEEINAVKPSIMAYIQQNAPNTEVTFGKITNVGEGVDDAYSVPLFINGALIDTEIVFDEQGGSQDSFDAVMKKAIDAGRKKKTATFTKGKEKAEEVVQIDENL